MNIFTKSSQRIKHKFDQKAFQNDIGFDSYHFSLIYIVVD